MYIYKITNVINNKSYVGRTSDFERRKKEHKKKGRTMRYAFDEYGIENFSFEILCEVETKEESVSKEIEMIAKYNTLEPNGYNKTRGGLSNLGFKHSDRAKNAISRKRKGKYTGEENSFYGKKHSDETRAKMRAAWRIRKESGYVNKNSSRKLAKKVVAIETGEEFCSMKEAAEKYNTATSCISRACKNPNRTAGKLHWKCVN